MGFKEYIFLLGGLGALVPGGLGALEDWKT